MSSTVKINSKFLDHHADFGILRVNIKKQIPDFKWMNWVLNIDRSGSMNDRCADGNTKMNHIHHTIVNMVEYFISVKKKYPNVKQYLSIIGFDHEPQLLCDCLEVTDSDTNTTIKDIISKLIPRGATDIYSALKFANKHMKKIKNKNTGESSLHGISHIFMSDGQITSGISDAKEILSKISQEQSQITNTFVGYGTCHDAKLMKTLSEIKKGEYFFVDSLENAGMVYGEILYNSLYEYITNLCIRLDGGAIYNFKTNKWVKTLNVDAIASGTERTWHIKKHTDCDAISINGTCDIFKTKNISVPTTIPEMRTPAQGKDLEVSKYEWRQKTQEIMCEINEYNNHTRNHQYKHGIEATIISWCIWNTAPSSAF